MAGRVLHQFPISHYCEKSRWHLDAKGLDYTVLDLLPGVHILVNRRVAGTRTVPVLVDGGRIVADSTDIALHLERTYGGVCLLPPMGPERDRVLELEEYFDGTFGPAVRRFMYGQAILTPGLIPELFFRSYGERARRWGKPLLGRVLTASIRRMYRITPETVERSSRQIDEAALRLETLLEHDPSRYLVGERFTLADLTAASLLAPLVGPPRSPWGRLEGAPEAVRERREQLRERVAGRWVLERYAKDRFPP